MSRITAIGFVTIDAVLSTATIVQSSLTMAVFLVVLFGSIGITILSGVVRSILWPTYFWSDSELHRDLIRRESLEFEEAQQEAGIKKSCSPHTTPQLAVRSTDRR